MCVCAYLYYPVPVFSDATACVCVWCLETSAACLFFLLIYFKLETHAPANTFSSSLFRSGFGFFSSSSSLSSLFSCVLFFISSLFLFFSVRHVIYVNRRLFVSRSQYRQMHAPLADMCGEKAFYHCQCSAVVVAAAAAIHSAHTNYVFNSIHSHIRTIHFVRTGKEAEACLCPFFFFLCVFPRRLVCSDRKRARATVRRTFFF